MRDREFRFRGAADGEGLALPDLDALARERARLDFENDTHLFWLSIRACNPQDRRFRIYILTTIGGASGRGSQIACCL